MTIARPGMPAADEANGEARRRPTPKAVERTTRVVVIGGSWGSVYALKDLVSRLPPDFATPIVIVTHIGPNRSVLPKILSASGPLPARHAVDGEALTPGTIHLGPPDHHLLLQGDRLRISRGPKEHHTRPAIDPLFRSAALSRGPDVIGVVLTGMLDDGTAGLQAIKQYGGLAVVQDPQEAVAPAMPTSALQYVDVDHCLPVAGIARCLVELTATAVERMPAEAAAVEILHEHELFLGKGDAVSHLQAIGVPSTFVCPDCTGSLWEMQGSRPRRYRCHTGHAFTLRTLAQAQHETVDVAVWTALRALQEKEIRLRNLSSAARTDGDTDEARRCAEQASEVGQTAESLRRLLETVPGPRNLDDPE